MLVLGYNVPSLCSKGGAVSLDVKAYKFGGNSPLEGYDFIVYIEVNSENVYSLIKFA